MLALMPLSENYWELQQMMATYEVRLWTLYRPKCDHYKKVFHIHHLLDNPVVERNMINSTPILCRHIMWEMTDDSCQFFSSPLHSSDFANGKMPKFKSSLLDYVIPQVCFQKSSDHPLFPTEWRQTVMPIMTPAVGMRDGGRPVPAPPPNNL